MSSKALFLCGLVPVSTLIRGLNKCKFILRTLDYSHVPQHTWKKTLKWVEVQHPQDVSFNMVARQVWTFCNIFVAPCGPLSLEGVPPPYVELSPSLLCHFTLSDYNQWVHTSPLSFLQEQTGQRGYCQHFSRQPAHLSSLPCCTVVKCCSPPSGTPEIPIHACDWTGFKINHMPPDK